jgi:hypothetical protein
MCICKHASTCKCKEAFTVHSHSKQFGLGNVMLFVYYNRFPQLLVHAQQGENFSHALWKRLKFEYVDDVGVTIVLIFADNFKHVFRVAAVTNNNQSATCTQPKSSM